MYIYICVCVCVCIFFQIQLVQRAWFTFRMFNSLSRMRMHLRLHLLIQLFRRISFKMEL